MLTCKVFENEFINDIDLEMTILCLILNKQGNIFCRKTTDSVQDEDRFSRRDVLKCFGTIIGMVCIRLFIMCMIRF